MIYIKEQEVNTAETDLVDEIDKLTIPCPICQRMYNRVAAHAQAKHGIAIPDFKEIFHYTTAAQACGYRLLNLYGGRSDRYIQQLYLGNGQSGYITIDGNDLYTPAWNRFLGTKKAVSHLRGTKTYGVLFWDYSTKVLVFDFDFSPGTPTSNQEWYVDRIFYPLDRLQIPRKCIHVLKSGLKGYHVDLYFDQRMPTQALLKFAKYVVDKAGLSGLAPYVKVEFRPEKTEGGRGVRLPLGIHMATDERMLYLDSNFQPVPHQFKYLLYQTHRISKDDFFSYTYPIILQEERAQKFIINTSKPQRERKAVSEGARLQRRRYTREELDDFYENGLSYWGTRHNITLGLAIRLKELGHSQKEVRQLLYEWSRTKVRFTQSTLDEIIQDVNAIVKYVFENDCHLEESDDAEWLLTDGDLLAILNYHYLTLAEQKTLAIIFMIRRHFGPDAYYPQELIATLAGVDVRTVRNHITKFIELSILSLTYRGNSFKMHSNKYKIRDYSEEYGVAFSFIKSDINGETFIKAMKCLMSEEFTIARYSYYLRTTRLNPVEHRGYTVKLHHSIPSPLTTPTPHIECNNQHKKLVGRKIFESLLPIIAIFRLVRSFKRKHGSAFCKEIFRDLRYYMKC